MDAQVMQRRMERLVDAQRGEGALQSAQMSVWAWWRRVSWWEEGGREARRERGTTYCYPATEESAQVVVLVCSECCSC